MLRQSRVRVQSEVKENMLDTTMSGNVIVNNISILRLGVLRLL